MAETPVSETIKLGDEEFCIHTWNKASTAESVVVIYHGLGAHGLYPTVRYAAELLALPPLSCKVVAPDMRGHGKSSGLQGYLPNADVIVEDAYKVAAYAITEHKPKKLFFAGSSMGGTIALEVAQKVSQSNNKHQQDVLAGIILLAPMLKLSVSSIARFLLSGLASVLSTWRLIPSSSTDAEKQYRDDKKRQECENDAYKTESGSIRVGTANACVSLANRVEFDKVEVPFWLGVADEDVVVDKQGCLDLYELSPSTDRTMKRYAALHGLLCEPSPLFDEIAADILEWVRAKL